MSKLLRDSLLYAGGAVLIRSLGIILIPLYTRYFSLAEYGALTILNVFIQLFSTVFVFGINSAATRFYFSTGDAESPRRMYGTAFLLLAILPLIAGLAVAPILSVVATDVFGLSFFPLFFIALAIGVLKPLEKLATGLMRVQRRALHYVLFYVAMFLVQFLSIYFFVAHLQLGLKGQLFGQMCAALTFFFVAIGLLLPQVELSFDRDIAKRMLRYGLPLLPYFLFVWCDVAAPRMLLEHLGSLDEVGLFALASQFSGLLLLVGNASDNALIPHYYELSGAKSAAKELGRLATKFLGVAAMVSLGVYVFADDFVRLFTDEKFHAACALIPLLIVATYMKLSYRLVHWNLMCAKKTRTVSAMRGLGFVLLVVSIGFWVGYLHRGVFGIVNAMICTEAIVLIAGIWISQSVFRIEYEWSRVLQIGLICVAAGCVVEFVHQYWGDFASEVAGVGIFLAACVWVLRIIDLRLKSIPQVSTLLNGRV